MPADGCGGLLCDLDSVVRHWPAAVVTAAEDEYGLPPGSIPATAFAEDLLPLAITGQISDEAWREETVARLQAAHPGADASAAVAAWSASPGVVNQPVLDLLRRRNVPLVLVTNGTSRLLRDLAALNLEHEFDHIINSSRIGVAKPEWGIFEAALQVLDLQPDQAFFVDDDARHVNAAASFGIRSYQFLGNLVELEEVLRHARVLRE